MRCLDFPVDGDNCCFETYFFIGGASYSEAKPFNSDFFVCCWKWRNFGVTHLATHPCMAFPTNYFYGHSHFALNKSHLRRILIFLILTHQEDHAVRYFSNLVSSYLHKKSTMRASSVLAQPLSVRSITHVPVDTRVAHHCVAVCVSINIDTIVEALGW